MKFNVWVTNSLTREELDDVIQCLAGRELSFGLLPCGRRKGKPIYTIWREALPGEQIIRSKHLRKDCIVHAKHPYMYQFKEVYIKGRRQS